MLRKCGSHSYKTGSQKFETCYLLSVGDSCRALRIQLTYLGLYPHNQHHWNCWWINCGEMVLNHKLTVLQLKNWHWRLPTRMSWGTSSKREESCAWPPSKQDRHIQPGTSMEGPVKMQDFSNLDRLINVLKYVMRFYSKSRKDPSPLVEMKGSVLSYSWSRRLKPLWRATRTTRCGSNWCCLRMMNFEMSRKDWQHCQLTPPNTQYSFQAITHSQPYYTSIKLMPDCYTMVWRKTLIELRSRFG